MSIIDKVCGKIGLVDPDDTADKKEKVKEETPPPAAQNVEPPTPPQQPREPVGGSNVIEFHASASSREHVASYKMKVMVINPKSFDDAQQVADCLLGKKPVIVNFETTNEADARRIVDFISGATYTLNGEIKKVGNNVFLCAPSNVNVSYTEDKKTVSTEMPWLRK